METMLHPACGLSVFCSKLNLCTIGILLYERSRKIFSATFSYATIFRLTWQMLCDAFPGYHEERQKQKKPLIQGAFGHKARTSRKIAFYQP